MSGCGNEWIHTLDFAGKFAFFVVFGGAFRDNSIDIICGKFMAL